MIMKLKTNNNLFVFYVSCVYFSYLNGCCPNTQWDSKRDACVG